MSDKYAIPHINIILPGLAFLIAIVMLLIACGPIVLKYFRDRNILKSGIEAKALILELEDTGNRLNKNPQVRLKLNVTSEGRPSFHAEVLAYISVVDLPRYQPGNEVRIKYLPSDPSRVALVTK